MLPTPTVITHPGHAPVVILVNSVDPMNIPVLFPYDLKFDQAGIDEINQNGRPSFCQLPVLH